MVHGNRFLHVVAGLLMLGLSGATKKEAVKNNSGVQPAGQCGTWVKEPEGGLFTSPNYPNKYPPERECIYIIEAPPRQCIDLFFDEKYSIEPSWECKFDHIEVRDGPFGFSPIIGRYCGQQNPPYIRSSGRYLWIKFVADGELEAMGFSASYNFTADPDFKDVGVPKPLPFCEFEMGGPEGIIESQQITKDGKALQTEAVDCKWYIRAPPRSKVSPPQSSPVQTSPALSNNTQVVSLLSIIYYLFFLSSAPCEADTFFCHSNMCINNTLVCNGIQNCVYPWDENHCKEKRKANILDNLNNTNGTIIGVTCCIVLILLVVSVIVQIKQPRKKYILRREDFDPTMFQEVFQEPPHYELCTLRSAAATSADLAELAEDFESYHKLRRASSRCVHEHHCGSSQLPSNKGSRTNLSAREATAAILTDLPPQPMRPLPPQTNRRNILVMRHTYSQDAADACDLDDDLDEVPTTSHRLSRHEKAVQRFCLIGSLNKHESEYNTTRV
uniref:Neuropilin and tolloid like 1 n=1 Tax=Sinocyclocheilus grahami TaxID=75366 RepID=A0A672T0Z6_SINGR